MTDEQLVTRARSGDVRAFEELYSRHSRRALRVAGALTTDRELAAEAVQEAFIAIWRKLDKFRPEAGRFGSWAMAIVRHRTIDLIRSRAAAAPQALLDDDLAVADGGLDLAERAAARDTSARVRRALAALPDDQREAVVLGFFGGLSHSEIARHCGLPLGTVKGRMRIALRKLHDALEPQPVATPRWPSTARMNDARSPGVLVVAAPKPA